MRILHLHCDHVEYTPIKKEIPAAEETEPHTVRLEEVLVAFVAVEKGDDDTVASKATLQIKSVMERLGCGRLLLYPYAHLSADLAPARIALDVMEKMSEHTKDVESHRSAFGWTKSYAIQVKGHPLAEGLKIIRGGGEGEGKDESEAVRAESKIESHWYIMTPDGTMTPVSEFNFARHKGLEVLAKYEAAKKRGEDRPPPHVGLMKRLAIADYEPASDQGNMRYYPNGRLIKSLIERYVTKQVREYGGFEVETPIMYDSDHPSMIKYFNRFPARQYTIDSEGKQLFLRFAACFGQFLMANDFQMSYKNLPYRLYELTRYSFRREQSGELVGLRRLRAFTMPDCHAFCADMEQAVAEAGVRFDLSRSVLRELGVQDQDYEMAVRFTRDFYEGNQNAVTGLVAKHGKPVLVEMWNQRFFYFVLKWEFNYIDSAGKASALSTDQIDVENGSRYGIRFVDRANRPQNPIILHNSPSGAIERVMYSLLEGAARDSKQGRKPFFPLWLAPTQVRIIPVHEDANEYAAQMADRFAERLVRADIDERNESIGKRVREAEKEWIPYVVVVGSREASAGLQTEITVRDRRNGGMLKTTPDGLISSIKGETRGKPYAMLNQPRLLSRRPQIMV
ncbi:MAG: threonine--tRNA ligase [Nitrosopumilaceae archaeon]|nr:threonine--tRNA ligase [Nitrosopumilaceae archaeon]